MYTFTPSHPRGHARVTLKSLNRLSDGWET